MDIKHRPAFAHLKQHGIAETQTIHATSIIDLASSLVRLLAKSPPRYDGLDIIIRFSPESLKSAVSAGGVVPQEPHGSSLADLVSHLVTTDDAWGEDPWALNPNNPDSPLFDPLLARYNACRITSTRERTTPAELATLKQHVTAHYTNSPWWDGIHHW